MGEAAALRALLAQAVELAARLPDQAPAEPRAAPAVVAESHLAKTRGYKRATLQRYRYDGTCIEYVHWYITPDGRIVWDEEAFDRWQRGEQVPDTPASGSGESSSRSASRGAAIGSGSASTYPDRLRALQERRDSARTPSRKAASGS